MDGTDDPNTTTRLDDRELGPFLLWLYNDTERRSHVTAWRALNPKSPDPAQPPSTPAPE